MYGESCGAMVQGAPQVVGSQVGSQGRLRRWSRWNDRSRGQSGRGQCVQLADVDQSTRLIGDVDCKVMLSRRHSRGNRSSASRHSAGAQVRRAVVAPAACNQVLPTFRSVARQKRGHSRVTQDGRAVSAGRNVPEERSAVTGINGSLESSGAGSALRRMKQRRASWDLRRIAKIRRTFAGLSYVGEDSGFQFAEDGFQICCRGRSRVGLNIFDRRCRP
jgi:hypothetical protein